jgi:hypothetical protein
METGVGVEGPLNRVRGQHPVHRPAHVRGTTRYCVKRRICALAMAPLFGSTYPANAGHFTPCMLSAGFSGASGDCKWHI